MRRAVFVSVCFLIIFELSGMNAYCGSLSSIQQATPTVPSPPLNLEIKVETHMVSFQWSPPTSDGGSPLLEYYIHIYDKETGRGGGARGPEWFKDYTMFSFELIGGKSYGAYVTAKNAIGESAHSNEVNFTAHFVPAPIEDVTVTTGNKYVYLNWMPPPDDGGSPILNYTIRRWVTMDEGLTNITVPDSQLYYNDTDVINEVKYNYEVFAVNEYGSVWGELVFATPGIIDHVEMKIEIFSQRFDLGSDFFYLATGRYVPGGERFLGTVSLNDTAVKQVVGSYGYKVSQINDQKYGVGNFTSNEISVIFDRVKVVDGGSSKSSVTPGQSVTVWFKAVYEFDSEQFDGNNSTLLINYEPSTWSNSNQRWEIRTTSNETQSRTFVVTGIQDTKYQLSVFTDATNPISVEWKQEQAEISGYLIGVIIVGSFSVILLILFLNRRKNLDSIMKIVHNK